MITAAPSGGSRRPKDNLHHSRLAKRRGLGRAKVALARKLAVVMHRMWMSGEDYRLKAAAL